MAAMLSEEIVGLDTFGRLYGEQLRHPFFEVFHLRLVFGQDAGCKRTHDDVGSVGSRHVRGSCMLVTPA